MSNLHGPSTAKPSSGANAAPPAITRKGLIGAGGISKAKSKLPPDVNERMRAVSKRSMSVDVSPVLSRSTGGSPMLRDDSRFGYPITEAPTVIVTNGTPPATEGAVSARERPPGTPGPISSMGAPLYSPKPIRPHEPNEILNGTRTRGGSHPSNSTPKIGLGKPPGTSKLTLQSSALSNSTDAPPPPPSHANGKSSAGRSAFTSSFAPPNTEVLLWSYAQLLGTIELDESNGVVSSEGMAGLRSQLNALRSDRIIGGGRMDIGAPATPSPLSGAGSRTRRGLISSFLSVGMGGSNAPSPVSPGGALGFGLGAISSFWNSPAPSPVSTGFGMRAGNAAVASPMAGVSGGLPETALPTFETQPSMLAIDLNLAPGESRSYTYSVPLPAVLPPTFRGKAMKFSYHLVIGSSRARSSNSLTPYYAVENGPQSRIMRVPVRIYNNVSVERPPMPYDLLWPLARRKSGPVKSTVTEDQSLIPLKPFGPGSVKRPTPRGDALRFEEYANRLLILSRGDDRHHPSHFDGEDDSRSITNTIREPGERTAGPPMSPAATLGDLDEEMSGGLTGCRENVEILTRVSRKMSYDISKDGVKVAVLTFVKTAFRVGETVMGVVEFNGLQTRGRVLKFSAVLETQETLPPQIAEQAAQARARGLKRVHAEHHSSMVMDSLRAPFMLEIPSDASPGFRVAVDSAPNSRQQAAGGLEWRVRMCFLVAIGSPPAPSDDGSLKASTRHLVRDGPIGDWGSSWKATPTLAPLTVGDGAGVAINGHPYYRSAAGSSSSWTFFSSSRNLDHQRDLEGWTECTAETVECEVGITVWPGNTLYRPTPLDFEV
ncbi:hypothetical protein FRB90_011931 [Tulasnella sp. 427]|nr:hypothetical protein FRB90_011931 [Tulasnella sp. 427]